MRTIVLAMLAAAAIGATAAKTPERLDALDREMRILSDVLAAALREGGGPLARVRDVDVSYLAEQGVLISLSLSHRWVGAYHRVVEIDADGDASLAVPTMVREILHDLEIPLTPFDAEEQEALREERLALGAEMRGLRARIREERRKPDGPDEAELTRLKAELDALREDREALRSDLRERYAQVHVLRGDDADDDGDGSAGDDGDGSAGDGDRDGFDAALVQAVCDYGMTLKSLPKDERLSVKVRGDGEHLFHVFKFEDVLDCASEGLTPAELEAAAFVYSVESERSHHRHGWRHRGGRHHHHGPHHGHGPHHPKPPATPLTPSVPAPPDP